MNEQQKRLLANPHITVTKGRLARLGSTPDSVEDTRRHAEGDTEEVESGPALEVEVDEPEVAQEVVKKKKRRKKRDSDSL